MIIRLILDTTFVIATVLAGISLLRQILIWTRLFQLKEYRGDRISEFLYSPEGLHFVFSRHFYASLSLVIFSVIYLVTPSLYWLVFLTFSQITVWGIFNWRFGREVKRHLAQIPVPTPKAISIVILTIFILGGLSFAIQHLNELLLNELILLYPFLHLLASLIVLLAIYIILPLDRVLKQRLLVKARRKREAMQNLIVIGITGSYGKTSVKEFLARFLSPHYSLLITSEHVNTEIGVAKLIINELTSSHQILVVEMGAYRIGEIKKLCRLAKPELGIITGIDEQHAALFGGIEKTIVAKGELLAGLPDNGIAILNADSRFTNDLAQAHLDRLKIIRYGITSTADARISDIVARSIGVSFNLNIGDDFQHIEAPALIGKHVSSNITAAFLAARELGVPDGAILDTARALRPPAKTMQLISAGPGIDFIDDSYNANPSGVSGAINHLLSVSEKATKIIVLDDIIELGKDLEPVYQRLRPSLAKLDLIIYVGKNYGFLATAGLPNQQFQIITPAAAADYLKHNLKAPSLVLFKGRAAGETLRRLIHRPWSK